MNSPVRLLFCAMIPVLLGCGGGSAGSTGNPTPPPPPVAIAVQASPEAFVLPSGGQASLLSSVEGSPNQAVTWSSTAGQVTQAGMFTAPAAKGPLTIQASSVANPASTAEIQVLVDDDGAASGQAGPATSSSGIWPSSMTLQTGQSAMLLGFGGDPADLRWALDEGSMAGSLTPQGSLAGFALARYQAPAEAGVFHASLTSALDSTLHARAKITVRRRGQVSVAVLPSSATLQANGSRSFHAQVTGTANRAVTWSATAGSITSSGVYTAPSAPGAATVRATSVADSTRFGEAAVTITGQPAPPAISSFMAVPPTITAGQSSTLSWTVNGATSLSIDHGVGAVTGTSKVVNPGATTTYTLTATNAAGSATATATITVNPAPQPPTISSFTATPPTITAGQNSTLGWAVSGATSLSIDNGVGAVTGTSKVVSPGATTTYTLTASNAAGSVTATATVTVTPASQPPSISSFTAAPSTITAGQSSTLSWAVSGATSLSIDHGIGAVTGTSKAVNPGSTTTYKLTATNAAGSVTATTTVTVNPAPQPPTISNFAATPPTITAGQSSTLSWAVSGATSLSIDNGVGAVTGTSKVVSPGATTTYKLTATNAAGSSSATTTVTVNSAPPPPSGYLLLTASRLDQIRADAVANKVAWTNLHANVEASLSSTDQYDTGAENMAMAYLVNGDVRYAARAYWWAQQAMAGTLRADSYYYFQSMVRPVAMTLNYCQPALSAAQIQTLKNYLHASCDELWYHNQGSGWGLDDPANNYHLSFLAGTAFAGTALKASGDARGQAWLDLVNDKLTRPNGVFAYLDRIPGGDWEEGANYGEGSKAHLSICLSVLAGSGTNHFGRAFFAGSVRYAVYATQPGWNFLYPGGDLARESSMGVSPYTRAYLQPTVFWLADGPDRRLGQWYLTHAVPTYLDSSRSFGYRTGLWLDVAFRLDLAETSPDSEPLSYHAVGTEWLNARSGWDAGATSLSISGAPRILQSHQHQDTGHFVMWKQDWLAADASTYSHSGLLWEPQGQNLLKVPGVVMHFDESPTPGLRRKADKGAFFYAQVDATNLYKRLDSNNQYETLLNEHTREFIYLRPDTLVVFDRVDAKPAGVGYQWLMHFPEAPTASGSRYLLTRNGAGIALQTLVGGSAAVVPDTDLEAGTTSSRVAVNATGAASRFLHMVQVASVSAPTSAAQLVNAGSMRGLLWNGTVVLFSDLPQGTAPSLPLTYTLPDTATHTHILANLSGSFDVDIVRSASATTLTLRAGSAHTADGTGLLTFTDAGGTQLPSIASFTATPATITAGQSSTLNWSVSGAASLSIDHGVGAVTGASQVVSPGATTTYTLTATNAAGSVTATATVTVNPAPQPPTISSFIATPSAITAGDSSTLSWTVSGATSLSIDSGVGTVTGASRVVSPSATTTYTLTATNSAGSATASATVTVAPPSGSGCGTLDLGINSNLHGYRAFPGTSAWNQDVSALPVDPNSAAIINFIGAASGLKADFGSGLWQGSNIGIPYGVVSGSQAKVAINYQAYGDESDPGPMPVPNPAPIEGDNPTATGGDRHVLLLDRDNCILYELYGSQLQANGSWNADSGAIWDLRANTVRPYGWTSADAAGLPVFPGLARYDEVAAGAITHALRFTVPTSRRAYVAPASHWASSNTSASAPPMGMRVRLKASVNINGYPAQSRVILQALKTYGMILADNGSTWFMSGAPNAGWDNNDLQSLNGIKGSDLEVVQMGTIHTADPTGPAPTITFGASPATISSGQSSTLSWAATDASTVILTPDTGPPIGLVRGTTLVVNPTVTTIYTLTATGPFGRATKTVTVTVTVPQPPVISAFSASPSTIQSGQSSTLAWTVSGADSLTIAPAIGSVTGTYVNVSPTATTTYTLTAANPAGNTTAVATVTVSSGGFITPDNPGPADLQFVLHSGHNVRPISKWIYGFNGGDWSTMPNGTTLGRLGGNRWTAYNWETNASNAGSDWGPYSSDGYLSSSSVPGEAVRPSVANAQGANAAIIVTVPIQGWVAADKNGNVDVNAPVSSRFFPNLPKKPAALATTPDTTDGKVYQDEFVHWLDTKFPTAKTDPDKPIFYMLDNEPDLWNSTHLEIQRAALRYDQFLPLSIASAGSVKDQIPQALVFGPVSYGWNGFVNLQNAPDAGAHGDFLDYYLSQMRTAGQNQGRRLLDVLDLHWYSEAQGGGVRVVNQDNSAAVAAARVQAPRSLWDAAYTETSWITQYSTNGPIQLIPRMAAKITAQYPGTKLAFSEYNHGGENHISGAIAEADCLGIFGRDGVFAANFWPMQSTQTFLYGAFRIFRNYDGAGAAFGDTSFEATGSDIAKASVYSSLDAGLPNRVVTVLLNKDTAGHSAGLALTHTQAFGTAQVYQITANSPVQGNSVVPSHLSDIPITKVNAFTLTLPPMSITVVVWK
ncbi:MAG: heparinase II/III family protein [Holophagaceae bacterium]|nr:heparinase II/III family protein [Holophagaceae bacterium]